MKKLLFFLVMLISSTTIFAQMSTAFGLNVKNNSGCTVYYRIVGNQPCTCGEQFSSPVIALAAGGSIFYPNSIPLGGSFPTSSPRSIMGAYIYSGPTSCPATTIGRIGQSYCGLPALYGYTGLTPNCAPCMGIQARWITTPDCVAGIAQLVFN